MKKNLLNSKFLTLFVVLISFVSCSDNDDDDGLTNTVNTQDFIWQAMNLWYFWQSSAPNLADDKFSTNEEYTDYLGDFPDPVSFFYDELLVSEDRFSYITEDYNELVNSQAGVSKSNGLEFSLLYISSGSNEILGYVEYIIPGSDASEKNIARGDIFIGVDGVTLTDQNYIDLLFGDNDTYTLNMAVISNSTIVDNNVDVTLTKEEGLVENPVFIAKTFDIDGTKIGYVMYNAFTSTFDEDLNDAFGQLMSEGATELVIDFRYNSGGSVNSAIQLSSMIYGTKTNELFVRQRWNEKIQPQLSNSFLDDYFTSITSSGNPINSLDLNNIYVLTSSSTASASELVVNGLDPYIDITLIGDTTRGKNEFSILLVDDVDNSFVYNEGREGNISLENSYGIQPLVGRNENSVGFYDYTSGFDPDIEMLEYTYLEEGLGVLGDENEPMLARAIEEITGVTGKYSTAKAAPSTFKFLTSSGLEKPTKDYMYIDKPIQLQ